MSILDSSVVVVVAVAAPKVIRVVILPAPISKPLLAVAIPIESRKVTSSYVSVPPTVTFPEKVALDPSIILNVEVPVVLIPGIEPGNAVLAIPTH